MVIIILIYHPEQLWEKDRNDNLIIIYIFCLFIPHIYIADNLTNVALGDHKTKIKTEESIFGASKTKPRIVKSLHTLLWGYQYQK